MGQIIIFLIKQRREFQTVFPLGHLLPLFIVYFTYLYLGDYIAIILYVVYMHYNAYIIPILLNAYIPYISLLVFIASVTEISNIANVADVADIADVPWVTLIWTYRSHVACDFIG